MGVLIGAGLAAVTTLVLLAGAAGHVLRPDALRDALRAHETVPARLVVPVAVAVPVAEGGAALLGAFALFTGWPAGLRTAMAWSAALLACYGAYAFVVARSRSGVPCGCSADGTPMTGWVAARAAVLGLLSAVAAVAADSAADLDGGRLATVLLAGGVFGMLLWELPVTMSRGVPR
ncbi:hypothetical protein GCM10010191_51540 [Actinomadura vinacea]|uniref:Methylamine utilisation protein MauE domain-containing protein n=1 Tax=Actinomadura vinacea TaxID=115336 RepID=A0ABN3JLB3_9ACTN